MKTVLTAIALLLAVSRAEALPLNQLVPDNATITFAGLQWAWGGPCPYSGGCGFPGDLSYQATQGWRLPTAAELALIPTNFADLFVFPGANVPAFGQDSITGAQFSAGSPGADAACASPYFNTGAAWCDWGDGTQGLWAGLPNPYPDYSEQLYVREPRSVPEPATLGLLGASLVASCLVRRRRV